jgi:polysaccharide biosynthesis protein PslH
MRILVISARFPEHGDRGGVARVRGDQLRAWAHIRHLAKRHEVSVVTAAPASSDGGESDLSEIARVRVVPLERQARALSAARWMASWRPAQIGWTMPSGAWRHARNEAATSDVALAITARSVAGPLPCPFVIDHIDALSYNLRNRAAGSEPLPVRVFARLEAGRMRTWEERVARFAAAQIATSDEVARFLPAHAPITVLPVAWRGSVFAEPPGHERDYDVVLSGDMHYPPNREAVTALTKGILPRVRERRPTTTALVVGRGASSLSVNGVDVASDVPDLHAYLRRARVAVVPLMKGAGSPYKTIEAAANGAALVATPWAVDCFGLPARRALTVEAFADEIVALLEDEHSRRALVAEAIPVVQQHSTEAVGSRLETVLHEAAETNPYSRSRPPA